MPVPYEVLEDENVPINARTYCGHLVPALNHCRRRTFFMPGRCTKENDELAGCLFQE